MGRPLKTFGAADRAYRRKEAAALARPEYSAEGAPIAEFNKRLRADPMIKRLREINAPRFEDVPLAYQTRTFRRKA